MFARYISFLLFIFLIAKGGVTAATSESTTSTAEDTPSRINTLYLGYDLCTLRPKDAATFSLNGFVAGYSVDFRITTHHPLYLGTGLDVRFTTRDKTFHDTNTYDAIKAKVSTHFLNFNVPINLSYRLPLSETFNITPQLGLDFRVQAIGKRTTTIFYPSGAHIPSANVSGFTPGSVNLFSRNVLGEQALRRFQAGWHAALKLQYDQFVLGISYGTDFAKLRNELGSSNLLVNLGYVF